MSLLKKYKLPYQHLTGLECDPSYPLSYYDNILSQLTGTILLFNIHQFIAPLIKKYSQLKFYRCDTNLTVEEQLILLNACARIIISSKFSYQASINSKAKIYYPNNWSGKISPTGTVISNDIQLKNILNPNYNFYINLDHRTDRKIQCEAQLTTIGFRPNRFKAIKHEFGAIGCSHSHLQCLKLAQAKQWPYVCIFEDDLYFLDYKRTLAQMNNFFYYCNKWDVLMLAGNIQARVITYTDDFVKISKVATGTAYIVKAHYYQTLIDNMTEAVQLLEQYPEQYYLYALDVYWNKLQRRDNWFLLKPQLVIQKASYSDIENMEVNYEKIMS